jgi:hypothetical protein
MGWCRLLVPGTIKRDGGFNLTRTMKMIKLKGDYVNNKP